MLGHDEIARRVTRYRDSIQFLWDQTVRLTNKGLSSTEIGHAIRLPASYDDDFITSEYYGVAEHHGRQIRSGLFGFFDGDPANLFPLHPDDHAARIVAGLGGRDAVRTMARTALDTDDVRWALQLAAWLARGDAADDGDRRLLAEALRTVAARTSAANIRNWCVTRALELDGTLDNSRLRRHRFATRQVVADPARSVAMLRVMLDPDAAPAGELRLAWHFDDGTEVGLHLRNGIAAPYDGNDADATLRCAPAAWAAVLSGRNPLGAAVDDGSVVIDGDRATVIGALGAFEVGGLRS